uniref:Uncharacterized protein n=1 Tax=Anguilla anguilla TaxID=7936 RepID=A0A0E9VY41_ANGAN
MWTFCLCERTLRTRGTWSPAKRETGRREGRKKGKEGQGWTKRNKYKKLTKQQVPKKGLNK